MTLATWRSTARSCGWSRRRGRGVGPDRADAPRGPRTRLDRRAAAHPVAACTGRTRVRASAGRAANGERGCAGRRGHRAAPLRGEHARRRSPDHRNDRRRGHLRCAGQRGHPPWRGTPFVRCGTGGCSRWPCSTWAMDGIAPHWNGSHRCRPGCSGIRRLPTCRRRSGPRPRRAAANPRRSDDTMAAYVPWATHRDNPVVQAQPAPLPGTARSRRRCRGSLPRGHPSLRRGQPTHGAGPHRTALRRVAAPGQAPVGCP